MELQKIGYSDAMSVPCSRRKRFVEQKERIETKRRQDQEQAAARARMAARRRR
jgi:hypothetical protein